MNLDKPQFSRCSLGKGKWFWVTFSDWCHGIVNASGIAGTAADAEKQARASILTNLGCDCPEQLPAKSATHSRHLQALLRRAAKTSTAQETMQPEFVYGDYTSDFDGRDDSIEYRIVKKTPKWVHVQHQYCAWEQNGQVYQELETFLLNRADLERDGCAYNRRRGYFYTTPYEERHKDDLRPPHLELLGVDAGCNLETLNAAYRSLATKLHPDHGGDPVEFKRLQAAYEMAMKTMQCCP
jgi:hypothetical protein